jgi:hypothetical protein
VEAGARLASRSQNAFDVASSIEDAEDHDVSAGIGNLKRNGDCAAPSNGPQSRSDLVTLRASMRKGRKALAVADNAIDEGVGELTIARLCNVIANFGKVGDGIAVERDCIEARPIFRTAVCGLG